MLLNCLKLPQDLKSASFPDYGIEHERLKTLKWYVYQIQYFAKRIATIKDLGIFCPSVVDDGY